MLTMDHSHDHGHDDAYGYDVRADSESRCARRHAHKHRRRVPLISNCVSGTLCRLTFAIALGLRSVLSGL